MSDRVSELEAKVLALANQVAGLADRLAAVEVRGDAVGQRPPSPVALAADASPGAQGHLASLTALPALGGRMLLVLAGGFVLRALTDGGVVPGAVGLALGIAYAVVLAALAERAARAGARLDATAHGITALLVACPLLYEAVARFHLLRVEAATAGLAAAAAGLLLLAFSRRLPALAWTAAAGCTATVLALMFQSERAVPGAMFLAMLATGAAWLGAVPGWRGLRWVAAVVANLGVLAVALRAVSPFAEEGPRAAVLVAAALLALTLATVAAQTLLLRRGARAFEAFQTAGAVGAGMGGAAILSAHGAPGGAAFGAAAAACGLAAYSAALTLRTRRPEDPAFFPFFTSAGALLLWSGLALALRGPARALVEAALAVASAWLARRLGRRSLAVHAALWAWASAAAGGLLSVSAAALLAAPARAWVPLGAPAAAALLAAAACAWLTRPGEGPESGAEGWTARAVWLALLVLVAAGGAGLAVALLARVVAGAPGPDASRGTLAAVRTVVLVAAAALLALAGQRDVRREARWLAYGLLGLTGFKILAEDLLAGRAVPLVVSFGVYGVALLVLPRLRRRGPAAAAAPGDPPRAATG